MTKKVINLIYYKKTNTPFGNFGDELSKFITQCLINKEKYILVFNQKRCQSNIVCIGSYIHAAVEGSYIFGSGIRIPNGSNKCKRLKVCAIRGPKSKHYLETVKHIDVPSVFGDPALLMPMFYTPEKIIECDGKIGVVPHMSNLEKYTWVLDSKKYVLISPLDEWKSVINKISSCKWIVSSSLHGLICADAYGIPNIWLDEFKLSEGTFKFHDYFMSQKRKIIKIDNVNKIKENMLYTGGNQIDLKKLINAFPFR